MLRKLATKLLEVSFWLSSQLKDILLTIAHFDTWREDMMFCENQADDLLASRFAQRHWSDFQSPPLFLIS